MEPVFPIRWPYRHNHELTENFLPIPFQHCTSHATRLRPGVVEYSSIYVILISRRFWRFFPTCVSNSRFEQPLHSCLPEILGAKLWALSERLISTPSHQRRARLVDGLRRAKDGLDANSDTRDAGGEAARQTLHLFLGTLNLDARCL